jgi:hypothetical protein
MMPKKGGGVMRGQKWGGVMPEVGGCDAKRGGGVMPKRGGGKPWPRSSRMAPPGGGTG